MAEVEKPFVPELLRRTILQNNEDQDEAAVFEYITRPQQMMLVTVNPVLIPTVEEQATYQRRGALQLALLMAQRDWFPGPSVESLDEHLYRLEEFFAHTR